MAGGGKRALERADAPHAEQDLLSRLMSREVLHP